MTDSDAASDRLDRSSAAGARRRPDGPPIGVLGIVALVLSIGAVVVPLAVSGVAYPTPSSGAAAVAGYFTGRSGAGILAGFFTFAASVPIGILTATIYARLLRLGIRVPGPNIALVGGITASSLLAGSGLLTWSLAEAADGLPAAAARLVFDAAFAFGGIGFVGGIGLLTAGVAVPAVILGLVPTWLAWVGLVIAAAAEVSFLGLLWPGFDVLLPIGRFAGLLWLSAIGFLLPLNRHEVPMRPER